MTRPPVSSAANPLTRLCAATMAPLRRLPFPALALAVCLLFAAVGIAVLDDYGVSTDIEIQRETTVANIAYIMGDRDALDALPVDHERFYGIAFALPLLLVERLLGLQDSRGIFLTRHLLTHLFYIAGGFCCGLLAWRMFGSRWLALLAMLLFLLHPRLYAHSFFNSRDVPFLVMFVFALYLTHRAFRRDTLTAFALLGVVVGAAVNLRPFALLLIPAVLAMRGLDWRQAPDGGDRQRILRTAGSFAAAALLAIYVTQPYYWENPLRFIEGLQTLSRHPTLVDNLFQGQIIRADEVPPRFIPVWFGITAPPVALLLGSIGAAAVCWQAFRAPGKALRHSELRFRLLILACFLLPVAAVIALQSNIYNGWRHLYFLWAPFCLLAAAGLHQISLLLQGGGWPRWAGHNRLRQAALYGAAGAGLAGVVAAMVSLHPNQQVYFNFLVNRQPPGELSQQYDLDYWEASMPQGLKYLLQRYPDDTLYVLKTPNMRKNLPILPAAERERIALSAALSADFHIGNNGNIRARAMASEPAVYTRQVYGNDLLSVVAPRLAWGAGLRPGEEVYRAAYRSVTAAGSPAARSDFDVYATVGALYYVKENCAPADTAARIFLHLYPADQDDLPAYRREYGFDNRSFDFDWRGGYFDGKCITQEPLPDYPIARIRTGQWRPGEGQLWQAEFPAPGPGDRR